MNITLVINAIRSNRIRITDHADEETKADNLTYRGIYHSVINGEIIEDYLTDKPYPSCLVYGKTEDGEPIHTVWAYNKQNRWAVLITVYRPDSRVWIDFRKRRKKR